jgi:hypothetical protein
MKDNKAPSKPEPLRELDAAEMARVTGGGYCGGRRGCGKGRHSN